MPRQPIIVEDLGLMAYREAWARQETAHAEAAEGGAERLFLVEHPPVITLGRRSGIERNIVAPADQLAKLGVERVHCDRGGDVTFHGPGQVVAYPIVRLADRRLSVGGYVRRLEEAAIAALADLGVAASKDPAGIGVWVDVGSERRKICALGVRIRRGTSLHGIALNVSTNLRYFELIVPCGLTGRKATSLREVLGEACPDLGRVKRAVADRIVEALEAKAKDG